MHRNLFFHSAAVCVLALGLSACREQPIAHYRISKEPAPVPAAAPVPAMPAMTPIVAGAALPPGHPPTGQVSTAAAAPVPGGLMWKAPEHWSSQPGSAQRRATYLVSDGNGANAELAVTVFPGDVGGEFANVNRWRSQLQLPSVSEAAHAAAITRYEVGDLQVAVVDLTGGSSTSLVRMLGAIVPFGDATWFFKFTGNPALIEREKAAFQALLQTLHSESSDHACCPS